MIEGWKRECLTSCERVWRHARGYDVMQEGMTSCERVWHHMVLNGCRKNLFKFNPSWYFKEILSHHYNLNSLVFPMLFIPTSGILYRKVSLYSTSMLLTNYEALISFHIPFRCYHIFNTCDLNKTKYIKMLTNTLKTMSDVNFMEIYLFLYI